MCYSETLKKFVPTTMVPGLLLALAMTPVARAATVEVTGHNDNSIDGYEALTANTTYHVPADTQSTVATFNNNSSNGFYAADYTNIVIDGGQFNNDIQDGLFLSANTTATVNGGTFAYDMNQYSGLESGIVSVGSLTTNGGVFSNGIYGINIQGGVATINNAQFASTLHNGVHTEQGTTTINGGAFDTLTGADASNGGTLNVYGGQFSSSDLSAAVTAQAGAASVNVYGGNYGKYSYFVATGSQVNVYGQFDGLTIGQTDTLTDQDLNSFHGQLEYAAAPQTLNYENTMGGSIVLHDVALVPEPASIALLGLGAAGLVSRPRRVKI